MTHTTRWKRCPICGALASPPWDVVEHRHRPPCPNTDTDPRSWP